MSAARGRSRSCLRLPYLVGLRIDATPVPYGRASLLDTRLQNADDQVRVRSPRLARGLVVVHDLGIDDIVVSGAALAVGLGMLARAHLPRTVPAEPPAPPRTWPDPA